MLLAHNLFERRKLTGMHVGRGVGDIAGLSDAHQLHAMLSAELQAMPPGTPSARPFKIAEVRKMANLLEQLLKLPAGKQVPATVEG